jgi:demethylmenaquinone methyltransferase/2-methoxy-6-polyprenyl-1,4-benzoquinol methylase
MQYGAVSKFYGLLDILYFNRKETSPRYGILDFISDEKLKVLEVCIGTAENSIIIAEKRPNTEIVGVDLSKEMLEIAKEKIEKMSIRNIRTFVMDATNMNFDDNYFDIVLISLVLHEVDDKIRYKIMKEAKRVK